MMTKLYDIGKDKNIFNLEKNSKTMKFDRRVTKQYSDKLVDKFQEGMFGVLDEICSENWELYKDLINLKSYEEMAISKKRKFDHSSYELFKRSLFYSSPVHIICEIAGKSPKIFERFFERKSDKAELINELRASEELRGLTSHQFALPDIFPSDIKSFLRSAIYISKVLGLKGLEEEFLLIKNDVEGALYESEFYQIVSQELNSSNNLPTPDYDNWNGFIGRDELKRQVIDDILKGDNKLIALTGPGGIGKSALAIDIGRRISKNKNSQFRHIVWVTSKIDQLSHEGIVSVNTDYTYTDSYIDFLNKILSGYYGETYLHSFDNQSSEQLEKDVKEAMDEYGRTLFIIDNLENISNSQITDFVKNDIKSPHKALITSRIGLGEINKVYNVPKLSIDEGLELYRNINSYLKLSAASASEKEIKTYLKLADCYPLAIKFCLELHAKGKSLDQSFNELRRPDGDFGTFIFRKIYKQLAKPSKDLVKVLSRWDRLPERNLIEYMLSMYKQHEFEDALYELERKSFVVRTRRPTPNGSSVEIIELIPLSKNFIDGILQDNQENKRKIENKIIRVKQELEQGELSDDKLLDRQKLARHKAFEALKLHKRQKRFSGSQIMDLLTEARKIAPGDYMIDFYDASIELSKNDSERNLDRVSILLNKCIEKGGDTDSKVHMKRYDLHKVMKEVSKMKPIEILYSALENYSGDINLSMIYLYLIYEIMAHEKHELWTDVLKFLEEIHDRENIINLQKESADIVGRGLSFIVISVLILKIANIDIKRLIEFMPDEKEIDTAKNNNLKVGYGLINFLNSIYTVKEISDEKSKKLAKLLLSLNSSVKRDFEIKFIYQYLLYINSGKDEKNRKQLDNMLKSSRSFEGLRKKLKTLLDKPYLEN
jgi:hypothetical protein